MELRLEVGGARSQPSCHRHCNIVTDNRFRLGRCVAPWPRQQLLVPRRASSAARLVVFRTFKSERCGCNNVIRLEGACELAIVSCMPYSASAFASIAGSSLCSAACNVFRRAKYSTSGHQIGRGHTAQTIVDFGKFKGRPFEEVPIERLTLFGAEGRNPPFRYCRWRATRSIAVGC